MKKIFGILAIVMVLIGLMSCSKKFEMVEVKSNEWAILVPYEGDTSKQAAIQSLEFYEQNLISGKRVTIPYKKINDGTGSVDKPMAQLLVCPRDSVTRTYYNEMKDDGKGGMIEIVGDKRGFPTETMGSAGITVGVSYSARITNAAKWFFYKGNTDLTKFLDSDVYGVIATAVTSNVAKYKDEDLTANKNELAQKIKDAVNAVVGQFGVEVYTLGIYGGIIFDNPEVQKQIDNLLISSKKKDAALAEVSAEQARQALIPLKRQWAEIALMEAKAEYIKQAAAKGISLVPQVQGSSGTIIDLTK